MVKRLESLIFLVLRGGRQPTVSNGLSFLVVPFGAYALPMQFVALLIRKGGLLHALFSMVCAAPAASALSIFRNTIVFSFPISNYQFLFCS
jgi:hypothetical protein